MFTKISGYKLSLKENFDSIFKRTEQEKIDYLLSNTSTNDLLSLKQQLKNELNFDFVFENYAKDEYGQKHLVIYGSTAESIAENDKLCEIVNVWEKQKGLTQTIEYSGKPDEDEYEYIAIRINLFLIK